MRIRSATHIVLPALLIALLAGRALAANDVESFDCKSADGWLMTNFKDGQPRGASLGNDAGHLKFAYRRQELAALVHMAALTELVEMRITLQSVAADITAIVAFTDLDGARFHHVIALTAGTLTTIRLAPGDFKLSDDSPVKKRAVEPARLGIGYALVDLGAITGATGDNAIRIDRVEIETPPMERTTGEWLIEKPTVVTKSRAHTGNVIIRKGGTLKVSAARFRLDGSIDATEGTIEMTDVVVQMPQAFNHQYHVTLADRAKWKLRNSVLISMLPLMVQVTSGTAFTSDHTSFAGGMTVDMSEGSTVTLDAVENPGEFVIGPKAALTISGSKGIMLWLALGKNQAGELKLPDGDIVESWTSANAGGHQLDVKLKECLQVSWGILSMAGGSGPVVDTKLRGCGLMFAGGTRFELKDIQNRKDLVDVPLTLWDRTLRFRSSRVEAFNIYAAESATVHLTGSMVGEIMTFDSGRVEAEDTVVDGSGGYVGATGTSTIHLRNCKLHCLVLARDGASIVLEDCELHAAVRATGSATITMQGCKIFGRVENDPGARLVIIPASK
ncbi:MAG: hypothetical protein AB7K09_08560 [Planctomycetota bacterium]